MTIYVVNRTKPGQNQGDWAVRTGNKIISQHRLKKRAVKRGRREASKRNTGLRIQKANGKWQEK